MGSDDLEEYLKEKKEEQKMGQEINWQDVKEEWLKYIDGFYNNITIWLGEYKNKGLLNYRYEETTLNEEHIGEYDTRKLIIDIFGGKVVFQPVGTNIIAARGRIDLIGHNGSEKFILVNLKYKQPRDAIKITFGTTLPKKEIDKEPEEIKYVWKIATNPPDLRFIELNRDSFSDFLLGVIK